MSFVTLIIVSDDTISISREHYRKIIEILKRKDSSSEEKTDYLDAGYILIDDNLGIIINEQNAFDINMINRVL